ncbi:carbohydrate-binding module family 14 protein [Shimia abyssi]|uniref:Chitin binding peritrophin-A-like protein n=1 Tax=Shimia abyssi TaxID=1662395 RepID=A0A2P8FIW3_9RHOB|nr:carbohydrate-binding module family 14 protein [Shimia abyssi]PSL21660.1 chitin binding peritrophin-A-like protein [Shimia abyssi]
MYFFKLLAVTSLVMAPGLASAIGCQHNEAQTFSCAEGMAWDQASQSCIKLASS